MATTETPNKKRHLHLLCRVNDDTPSDAHRITATCGCTCAASQKTVDLLNEPGEHVVYCLSCFMQEHD